MLIKASSIMQAMGSFETKHVFSWSFGPHLVVLRDWLSGETSGTISSTGVKPRLAA